jgi:hypothetical protein
VLPGGVPLHGLAPGTYTLRVTLSFLDPRYHHRRGLLAGDAPTDDEWATSAPLACRSDVASPLIWKLADLTRTFVVEGANSSAPRAMGIVEEASPEDRVLEKSPRPMDDPTDGAAANSGEDDNGASPPALSRTPKAPPRPPVATASECGSFSDDSEWCVYRRACLAVGTLGLVLLDAAPYAPDTSFRRGRSDDSMFVPTSLDRRRASGEGLSF